MSGLSGLRGLNSERAWLAFAIVAGVGLAVQMLAPPDLSDIPESSFDTAPRGNAALFELLSRFDQTEGRWVSGLSMPPESDTIWWIAPNSACESAAASVVPVNAEDPEESEAVSPLGSSFQVTVRPWIEAGGTALVWLPHLPLPGAVEDDAADSDDEAETEAGSDANASEEEGAESIRAEWESDLADHRFLIENGNAEVCDAVLGIALPPRLLLGLEGGELPQQGRHSPIVFSVGRSAVSPAAFDYAAARTLPGPTLSVFELGADSDPKRDPERDDEDGREPGWKPLWVEADSQAPFALRRALGKGQLIVAADARVVSNARLAHADSAPFVVDWVSEWGRPWIDEHAHGVVAETGTFRYLMASPAWASCVGLVVLGVLFVWRGHAWPTRIVEEANPDAPTLGKFVDSVAQLYGQSDDHQAVFERYREVCLERVRRGFGLSPGTSSEIILASLRARAENWPALREAGLAHLLTQTVPISNAQDLDRNAGRLDDLVRVVRASGHGARPAADSYLTEKGKK